MLKDEKNKKEEPKKETKKETKEETKKETRPFVSFFSISLLISCVAINSAVIWKMYLTMCAIDQNSFSFFIQSIVIDFLSTAGIAVLLGAIFNWIIGTKSFVKYAKDKIVSVLISKEYIGELEGEAKRSMLRAVIKPTGELANTYSRIDDYFNLYVEKSMALFSTYEFRSSTNIVGQAKIEDGVVVVDYFLSYRSYVVDKEHPDMEIGLENPSSKVLSTKVSFLNGKQIEIESKDIPKEECRVPILRSDDSANKIVCAKIPDEHKSDKFIDVVRRIREVGNDHWINFSFRSAKPTDKLQLTIYCNDGLIVKDAVFYGPSDKFHIKKAEDNKTIEMECCEWMDPGYGLNILFAK